MRKIIFILLLSILTLNAQSYTKKSILGVWEVSSLKENGLIIFGEDNSKVRGEAYTLIFSKNKVKNKNTGTIYNYEIINGQLKIYKTKRYRNNYQLKDKMHYDLWKLSGSFENCQISKITSKKITGYYRKEGYKWCKTQEYPRPVNFNIEDYDF